MSWDVKHEQKLGLCGLLVHSSVVFLQVGFFKRNLKEKMEANVDASSEIPGEDAGQPEMEKEFKDPSCLEPLQKNDACPEDEDGSGGD